MVVDIIGRAFLFLFPVPVAAAAIYVVKGSLKELFHKSCRPHLAVVVATPTVVVVAIVVHGNVK